jgi:anti-anti-sigma regulatory factor
VVADRKNKAMLLLSANKNKQLLVITFIGDVDVEQCAQGYKDVPDLISQLEPGFRILADLTPLTSMSVDCAAEITKVMDLCAEKGVKLIIRVIPDPAKDIGFNILSRFHYGNKPRTIICENLLEAAKHLGLS